MKIVNATWEKENIGAETVEISIERKDDKREVLNTLKDLRAEYMVVKVPSDYEMISFELSALGYTFIETMNHISNDLHLKPLNEKKQKIVENTEFLPMTDEDFAYIEQKIMKDLMFRTDRVARDPVFSLEKANQRYVNWLRSERGRGASFMKFVYQGKYIGFDCCREVEPGVYDDFISGIFTEYAGNGLSVNISHKLNDFVKQHGGSKIITAVSSTNSRALSHHINNGYVIDSSDYIWVKHL